MTKSEMNQAGTGSSAGCPDHPTSARSERKHRLALKVDSLMDSWAVKYNVPTEKHNTYKSLMSKPLLELYCSVPQGNRPTWMDELEIPEQDTFSYVLRTAEEAYKTMYRTHRDLQFIKSYLEDQHTDNSLKFDIYRSLSRLTSSLGNDLVNLNDRFKERKNDFR